MSSNVLQPGFRYPSGVDVSNPHEVAAALIRHDNGLVDINQAIKSLKGQIDAIGTPVAGTTSTTTNITGASTTTIIQSILAALGTVNDQTGSVTYTVGSSDNGILLILNDASPVAVSLNSAVTPPFACFITNFGAGLVTLTPTSGTINGGATLGLLQNQSIWCVFSGTNWLTDAAFAPPVTIAPVAGEYLTGYNASTGIFSQSTPAGISATITTAALTGLGTQGSQTFTNGILTAQTPAT